MKKRRLALNAGSYLRETRHCLESTRGLMRWLCVCPASRLSSLRFDVALDHVQARPTVAADEVGAAPANGLAKLSARVGCRLRRSIELTDLKLLTAVDSKCLPGSAASKRLRCPSAHSRVLRAVSYCAGAMPAAQWCASPLRKAGGKRHLEQSGTSPRTHPEIALALAQGE